VWVSNGWPMQTTFLKFISKWTETFFAFGSEMMMRSAIEWKPCFNTARLRSNKSMCKIKTIFHVPLCLFVYTQTNPPPPLKAFHSELVKNSLRIHSELAQNFPSIVRPKIQLKDSRTATFLALFLAPNSASLR
jgi:hypothetical protein